MGSLQVYCVFVARYRFAEIRYFRPESKHKDRLQPARVETVVIFLPDVWTCNPTHLEWNSLQTAYQKQLQNKLSPETAGHQALVHLLLFAILFQSVPIFLFLYSFFFFFFSSMYPYLRLPRKFHFRWQLIFISTLLCSTSFVKKSSVDTMDKASVETKNQLKFYKFEINIPLFPIPLLKWLKTLPVIRVAITIKL